MNTSTDKWLPSELRRETAAIATNSFQPLARGRGRRARLVQEWLCIAGQKIAVDGAFGPATEQAVSNLRAARGLGSGAAPADGEVDAATFTALIQPMIGVLQPISEPPDHVGAAVVAYAERHLA